MADVTVDELIIGKILDLIYTEKAIQIPKNFHTQCSKIKDIIDNDVTGTINTVLNYAVDSASEANYRVEIDKNDKLELFLNDWLQKINQGIAYTGIMPGIKEVAKEYFKETWLGSSLSVFKVQTWKLISFEGNEIWMPSVITLYNGSSIYIDNPSSNKDNFELGSLKYYVDKGKTEELKNSKLEKIIVYKPYERWVSTYPTPYIIKKGIYKNFKAIEILQDKGDEVITKALPYLMLLRKGTDRLAIEGRVKYDDKKVKESVDLLKDGFSDFKKQRGKVPLYGAGYDTQLEHLTPEYEKVLKESLFTQSFRGVLSGLGMIDIISSVSNSRKESTLNPKPFISDVNARVDDVTKIISQIIYEIKEKNKDLAPRLFSETNSIKVVRSLLSINTEAIIDTLRGAYDRGPMSIETWQEILGLNPRVEKERRLKEYKNGDEDIYYPHMVQNQENTEDVRPSLKRKLEVLEKNESSGKQKGTPEALKYKNASISEAVKKSDLIIAPYKTIKDVPKPVKKLSEELQKTWLKVWNETYEKTKDEQKAFQTSWSVINKLRHKKE
jgi:cation transport regulator ChaB